MMATLNFKDSLAFIDVMQHLNNARANAVVPQDVFHNYFNELNTASCDGLPGVSDSFAAALWGGDYGLQVAYNNFA
ncbi:hypothetical protein FRC04_002484 [Tulasnella sp. 424]|nr:hypothetical protein FRC04_002484 [Tulasnella sp. 424]KAG8967067.1 hypothetical protein FRC05_002281 [Tulasnella sp. 425]